MTGHSAAYAEPARTTAWRPVASRRPHQATPAAAVLGLQRTAGNKAVAGRLAVQRDTPKEVGTAGKELGDVQGWAQDQQRSQKVLNIAAVVGLDLSQKKNVIDAIKLLNAALPAIRKASSPFAAGLKELRFALDKAKETEAALKGNDEQQMHAGQILKEGQAAMGRAITALQGVKGVSYQLKKNLKTLEGNMADTRGMHEIISGIARTITEVQNLDTGEGIKPEAVERVLFLLRSFVAVNDPAFADVPKPAEVAAMKGQMGSMQDDFFRVFGSDAQLGLFVDYADRLVQQIDVRDAMAKAGAPVKQVPGEADARAYFTKLRPQSNDAVFAAYTAFMQAFFFHKEVASLGDLTASNDALMSVPASITGTRPLVCTGYATLGAELMRLAGGTAGEIILAIRASDAQLLSGDVIDDGHAIAKFTRNGETRFISNHLIVKTEEEGIGPDAVMWTNKRNPLIRAKGATMAAAVKAVMDAMADARAAAKARAAKRRR